MAVRKNKVKAEAATRGVVCKKVFLEISQNSQENTCARVSSLNFKKTLLKMRPWHRCFAVNFVKFLWTPFLQNTSGRLLLLKFKKIGQSFNMILESLSITMFRKQVWPWVLCENIVPALGNEYLEAFAWRRSVKKVFLKISKNSLDNSWARASFLIKLQGLVSKLRFSQFKKFDFMSGFDNSRTWRTYVRLSYRYVRVIDFLRTQSRTHISFSSRL